MVLMKVFLFRVLKEKKEYYLFYYKLFSFIIGVFGCLGIGEGYIFVGFFFVFYLFNVLLFYRFWLYFFYIRVLRWFYSRGLGGIKKLDLRLDFIFE